MYETLICLLELGDIFYVPTLIPNLTFVELRLVSSLVRADAWCSNFDQNLNLWPIYRWILSSQILWVENKAGANLYIQTTNSLNWSLQQFFPPSSRDFICTSSGWSCFSIFHFKNAMNASTAFQTPSHKNDTEVFFRIIAHFRTNCISWWVGDLIRKSLWCAGRGSEVRLDQGIVSL